MQPRHGVPLVWAPSAAPSCARRGRRRISVVTVAVLGLLSSCASDGDEAATVVFKAPASGDQVAGGLSIVMDADGIAIEEAGGVRDGAGHFHVIADAGCVAAGNPVPVDADHVHFGAGQSEGTIYLSPGRHGLCLQVADGAHVALGITDMIEVQVGIADVDQWCAVVAEIDTLFTDGQINSDDFDKVRVSAEHLRRLFTQLRDGIDVVDTAARDAVDVEVGFGLDFTTAYADAVDFASAQTAMQQLAPGDGSEGAAGRAWILDHCGVNIAD